MNLLILLQEDKEVKIGLIIIKLVHQNFFKWDYKEKNFVRLLIKDKKIFNLSTRIKKVLKKKLEKLVLISMYFLFSMKEILIILFFVKNNLVLRILNLNKNFLNLKYEKLFFFMIISF